MDKVVNMKGVWWEKDGKALISLIIPKTSKGIIVVNNQNDKIVAIEYEYRNKDYVYSLICKLPSSTDYIKVCAGRFQYILNKQQGGYNYATLQMVGLKSGDWVYDAERGYVSVTEGVLKQIDGLINII